jgi:hypothetical protein
MYVCARMHVVYRIYIYIYIYFSNIKKSNNGTKIENVYIYSTAVNAYFLYFPDIIMFIIHNTNT